MNTTDKIGVLADAAKARKGGERGGAKGGGAVRPPNRFQAIATAQNAGTKLPL
ncbi:MAG: hypothetical protein WBH66_00535 [Rectinemataceae bacterium]